MWGTFESNPSRETKKRTVFLVMPAKQEGRFSQLLSKSILPGKISNIEIGILNFLSWWSSKRYFNTFITDLKTIELFYCFLSILRVNIRYKAKAIAVSSLKIMKLIPYTLRNPFFNKQAIFRLACKICFSDKNNKILTMT